MVPREQTTSTMRQAQTVNPEEAIHKTIDDFFMGTTHYDPKTELAQYDDRALLERRTEHRDAVADYLRISGAEARTKAFEYIMESFFETVTYIMRPKGTGYDPVADWDGDYKTGQRLATTFSKIHDLFGQRNTGGYKFQDFIRNARVRNFLGRVVEATPDATFEPEEGQASIPFVYMTTAFNFLGFQYPFGYTQKGVLRKRLVPLTREEFAKATREYGQGKE
jgi:hypothetical protein